MSPRIESSAPAASLAIEGAEPPPRPPTPPTYRTLHTLDGVPPAQRAQVHAANLALRKADVAEYLRYVDAFVAAHARCRTVREAKSFGEPASAPAGSSPGATLAEHYDYKDRYAGGVNAIGEAAQKAAGLRIREHLEQLRGEKAPFTVDASVTAGLSYKSGSSKVGVALGAATDGPATAEVAFGGGSRRIVLGATPGAGKPVSREYGFGPVTVTRRDGQPDRLEIDPMAAAPFGVTVATDRQNFTLCGRAGWHLGNEGWRRAVTAEVKACGTVHLTTADVFDEGVGAMLRMPARRDRE